MDRQGRNRVYNLDSSLTHFQNLFKNHPMNKTYKSSHPNVSDQKWKVLTSVNFSKDVQRKLFIDISKIHYFHSCRVFHFNLYFNERHGWTQVWTGSRLELIREILILFDRYLLNKYKFWKIWNFYGHLCYTYFVSWCTRLNWVRL